MADDRTRVPKVMALPAPDELRKLPLTPVDGFVLSRVDGTSTEDDIVGVTGLAPDQVRDSLARLAGLSLISLGDDGPARTLSGVATRGGDPSGPPTATAAPASSPASAPTTPRATSAKSELTPEEQRKIIDLYERIDDLDHYVVLGIGRAAEKKEIKRAYFERAAMYHPDRYFKRNVGDLKPRLEALFARMTLAHDVLTNKELRAEYDAYLGQVALTRELEDRVKQGEQVVREAEVEAGAPRTTPIPAEPTAPGAAPAPATGEVRRASRPMVPIDPQARRDLLAKHLRGGRPGAPSKAPSAPAMPAADPDALRRHFDQRKTDVSRAQAMRHKLAGDRAKEGGDFIAAASSYRAALSFSPNDPEIRKLADEMSAISESALIETYRNQATYEEKNLRWADAAKSWSKLTQLLPNDPSVHERAANAMLQARGSLHDAVAFAQRAVALAPQDVNHRKLLATAYLEAGLLKNARREIDAAEQLSPQDDSIAALAKRLASATGR